MRKFAILILILMLVLFGFLSGYLFINNRDLSNEIGDLLKQNKVKLKKELQKENELIRNEMNQKHSADIMAYETMAKRLELEKNNNKELEKQLE